LCTERRVRTLPEDRRPIGRPARENENMLKGMIAALAIGLALPAFAESDKVKDVKDTAANATDSAKDALHTDSGANKTKRHAKKNVRNAKKQARATKNDVKKDVKDTTEKK
jgi:hypothetical protein